MKFYLTKNKYLIRLSVKSFNVYVQNRNYLQLQYLEKNTQKINLFIHIYQETLTVDNIVTNNTKESTVVLGNLSFINMPKMIEIILPQKI